MTPVPFPAFEPHPLVRGGHAQTVVGAYLPARGAGSQAELVRVPLDDGDTIVLHDDRPRSWRPGDRVAVLLHGLGGSSLSGYMVRIAGKLMDAGVRVFRLDHRGCGAGVGLARFPYNAGRSEDALAALQAIGRVCPDSPAAIVGFSLSGNIVLKLLGEAPQLVPSQLVRAMAVNPSLDLHAAVECIKSPSCRLYDRNFVGLLYRQVQRLHELIEDPPRHRLNGKPREILEFDELYTAAVCGYGGAADYYARCSAAQFVHNISIPTLVLTARDDPLVPVDTFEKAAWPASVAVHIAPSGGHLGYVARRRTDPDRRWMDWRVVDWVTASVDQTGGQKLSASEQSAGPNQHGLGSVSELSGP